LNLPQHQEKANFIRKKNPHPRFQEWGENFFSFLFFGLIQAAMNNRDLEEMPARELKRLARSKAPHPLSSNPHPPFQFISEILHSI
jgi:hypothetical protein